MTCTLRRAVVRLDWCPVHRELCLFKSLPFQTKLSWDGTLQVILGTLPHVRFSLCSPVYRSLLDPVYGRSMLQRSVSDRRSECLVHPASGGSQNRGRLGVALGRSVFRSLCRNLPSLLGFVTLRSDWRTCRRVLVLYYK